MKVRTRFIKSVIETSRQEIPQMPWALGTRRGAALAARRQTAPRRIRLA